LQTNYPAWIPFLEGEGALQWRFNVSVV